jgi:hypothetical protein
MLEKWTRPEVTAPKPPVTEIFVGFQPSSTDVAKNNFNYTLLVGGRVECKFSLPAEAQNFPENFKQAAAKIAKKMQESGCSNIGEVRNGMIYEDDSQGRQKALPLNPLQFGEFAANLLSQWAFVAARAGAC